MEKYSEAFAEIEAVCRKYNMTGAIILSDGNNVHSCYGLDWATWSKVIQQGDKVGVPHLFNSRKEAEECLQTANMIHSIGEAADSISDACKAANYAMALAMKKVMDAEKQQNHARL